MILGLIALTKAVGYFLARFNLDLSSNGFVQGAGSRVHARLPALELFILVSLAAAALLIYNIRHQGWALPILGVGLWFLVALTAGTIYPAAVQALKVNPAQNTLERPYIQRNIDATRTAMGIQHVASESITPRRPRSRPQQLSPTATPWPTSGCGPPQTQPSSRSCRTPLLLPVQHAGHGRYQVNGVETPAIVGVREINDQDLPSTSWVNTTLQYTHGYGMIVSPANAETSNGDPQFAVGDVPPVSTDGLPTVTQPSVYFGLDNTGYVVANTKQPEIDYQLTNGFNEETHYSGDGGVQLSLVLRPGDVRRPFNDLNLLISNQITNDSRLMFDRGVQAPSPRRRRS